LIYTHKKSVRLIRRKIRNSLQVFVNRCLKHILNFKWSGKISNEELWQRTKKHLLNNE